MFDFGSVLTDVFDRRAEKRLSLEEERVALAAAQLGDSEATLALVLAYAAALRNGVSWYRHAAPEAQPADIEDAKSQAVLGLLEAIKAFDGTRHERLAATVVQYVRNALAVSAATATSFTVPERTLKRFFAILREAAGNVYTAAALAPSFEMTTETFLAVLAAVRNVDSYDELLESAGRDGSSSRSDGVRSSGSGDVLALPLWDNAAPDVEDVILVEAAFRAVDTLEKDVCRMAYGFTDYDPIPDVEIADKLGFSRAKVQRTRASALGKMRLALGAA